MEMRIRVLEHRCLNGVLRLKCFPTPNVVQSSRRMNSYKVMHTERTCMCKSDGLRYRAGQVTKVQLMVSIHIMLAPPGLIGRQDLSRAAAAPVKIHGLMRAARPIMAVVTPVPERRVAHSQ
jgi:hypothetical protein